MHRNGISTINNKTLDLIFFNMVTFNASIQLGTTVKPNLWGPSNPNHGQPKYAFNKTDFILFERLIVGINREPSFVDMDVLVSSFYKNVNDAFFLSVPLSCPKEICAHSVWSEISDGTMISNLLSRPYPHQRIEGCLHWYMQCL